MKSFPQTVGSTLRW